MYSKARYTAFTVNPVRKRKIIGNNFWPYLNDYLTRKQLSLRTFLEHVSRVMWRKLWKWARELLKTTTGTEEKDKRLWVMEAPFSAIRYTNSERCLPDNGVLYMARLLPEEKTIMTFYQPLSSDISSDSHLRQHSKTGWENCFKFGKQNLIEIGFPLHMHDGQKNDRKQRTAGSHSVDRIWMMRITSLEFYWMSSSTMSLRYVFPLNCIIETYRLHSKIEYVTGGALSEIANNTRGQEILKKGLDQEWECVRSNFFLDASFL